MYDIMVNHQGVIEQDMLAILAQKSRDNSRTPMQWNSGENAGFSAGEPWLSVADNYVEINAEQALKNNNSVFYYYQKLIQLRKEIAVITEGDYLDLFPEHKQVFAYQRRSEHQTLICLNNYYGEEAECELSADIEFEHARYLLGNYPDIEKQSVARKQVLRPYETRVILIDS